jgi:hypothetical protein
MHGENLRDPARDRRVGAMRQFPTGQVYTMYSCVYTPWVLVCIHTAVLYTWIQRNSARSARSGRARVSVNFRKFSPCIARARRAHAGLTVYPPSRPRFIAIAQAEVSKRQYSSKAKSSNIRNFVLPRGTVQLYRTTGRGVDTTAVVSTSVRPYLCVHGRT